MTNPPQHLLGGLEVAILVAPGSPPEHLQAARTSLEELGVNVHVLGPERGPLHDQRIEVAKALASADPDAYDGAVVIADLLGAKRLAGRREALAFLARLDEQDKPVAALGDGVLPVLVAGLAQSRGVSTPAGLMALAEGAGAVIADEPVAVDGNLMSVRDAADLAEFNAQLKAMLARRRQATLSIGSDIGSAVGEDG